MTKIEKDFVLYAKENMELEIWEKERELSYLENRYPLSHDMQDHVYDCWEDFCEENGYDDEGDYLDTEELFYEIIDGYEFK